MMMQQGFIPAQASHTKLNHNIDMQESDMMEIVTQSRLWEDEEKIALINNCRACGSNAAMMVAQPRLPTSATPRSA